ncbi:MAG: interleukin-like EMT inducer domain-containing protein, partial [Anaerolineae bacterium]
EPGDFAILQLPLGWRNSFGVQGAESTQTQYYQTYHHKRLLSGNISRNPPFKFDYFRQQPILESLITIETYGQVEAERRAADRAAAGEFVGFYDLRYVVVAPGVPGRPPYVDTRDEAVAYVEEVLPVSLPPIYDQDGWRLYRIELPPPEPGYRVDLGSRESAARQALGEGWAGAEEIQGSTARWAVAQGARLFLPAHEAAGYRLTARLLPLDYPGAGPQMATLVANGRRLETVGLAPGWNDYAWQVPAGVVQPGLNDLRFEFGRLDAPAEVLPGNGAIGTTGVQAPVAIEVNSGGPAGFAYITVEGEAGEEDGSLHSPGYNLAVIDASTGRLLERRGFDTTPGGSREGAADLAAFVERIPRGQIVVVAMQGDGAALLTEEAVAALQAIGGQADPRGSEGWSQAIIGVKGAAPGSALEAAGPENGWLRVAPDWRTLGAAADVVTWERME